MVGCVKRERIGPIAVGVALAALVAWSFWQRWQVLAGSPFPLGVDGYFYPIQLRSLLETGTLHYPSSPLTFWFMLPFAAATDPITGAKLGAALGPALVALPAYGVGARITGSRGAGLIAAALASTSATSLYLSIEFVKQGIGITVGLAALWLVLRALDVPSRPRIAAALAGLAAALLAHKLAAGVVLAIALPAALDEARGRGVLRGRRLLYLLAGLATLALVIVVLGHAFPRRFLSPGDAALVGGLLAKDAHWTAPALVAPRLTLAFEHDALLAALVSLAAAVTLRLRLHGPSSHGRAHGQPSASSAPPTSPRRSHGTRTALWIVLAFGIVLGLPWLAVTDPQGLAFRLRISAFVPLALAAAVVAGPALAAIDRLAGRTLAPLRRELVLAAIALVFAVRPHARPAEGMVLAHPAMVSAVMASTHHIPPGATVIVPERHILFMVAWYTRAKVSLRPEPVPYGERVRLLPLAFTGMGSPLDTALDRARAEPGLAPPIGLHPRHHNGLVLVVEPTWDWLLAQLPPGGRAHFARWPTI